MGDRRSSVRKLGLLVLLAAGLVIPSSASGAVREFPLSPGAQPFDIVSGPDGALWFTELHDAWLGGPSGRVGRITVDGSVSEFALPGPRNSPSGIAVGADGNLWFTDPMAKAIGRLSVGGALTMFANPVAGWPLQIVSGPDGALWFPGSDAIGRIGADGTFAQFAVPGGGQPSGVGAGADGALWFGTQGPATIGRMGTDGAVTQQVTLGGYSGPEEFVLRGGTMWAVDYNLTVLRAIGSDGSPGESVAIPAPPGDAVVGPDRAIWFTERTESKIGRWAPEDGVTEFDIPSGGMPSGITVGPDGGIWFTELTGARIGRLDVPPDHRAPHAVAVPARGRSGKPVQIHYRAWDDRGPTRVRVSVYRGTTKLWSTATQAADTAETDTETVTWRIPRALRGSLRIAVQAWDSAGNASRVAWSTLKVT